MSRFINIGIMQYEVSKDTDKNIEKIRENVEILMSGMNRPEVILGPELGIGLYSLDTIPGKITDKLGEIANKHGIYLLPGSMRERALCDGKEIIYNTMPIFGPNGELIDIYRKICPYYPIESAVTSGESYVIVDIKEKDIKLGVMICHDWCFPEIARNLTLLGAEILIRPAIDPEGLYESFKYVPSVRALENQAYFISLNAVGFSAGIYAYGHSMIADPEGRIIYEAGRNEINHCITLDADFVRRNREQGTFFTEQLVRQLNLFKIPMPFADDISAAPIFKTLPPADNNLHERFDKMKAIGLNDKIGKVK
ncbi:MAG: carbon-nitrogen hydrolase family protein [Bacillota bacterium]